MAERVEHRSFTPEQIARVKRRIKRRCHKRQRALVFDPGMYISVLCGRSAGKTTAILSRFMLRMVSADKQACLFIGPTRQAAERIVWRDLKALVDYLRIVGVRFNESKLECTFPNGSTLLLAGADDKRDISRLRGVTWMEVAVDETQGIDRALLEELELDVISPRNLGPFVIAGTPGTELMGMFYEATRLGSDQHRPYRERKTWPADKPRKWSSHSWSTKDGFDAGIPELVALYRKHLEKKAENGWSDENPHWKREYLGIWTSVDSIKVYGGFSLYDANGQPWNVWDPPKPRNRLACLPEGWNQKTWSWGLGMDQGFKDHFALEAFTFNIRGDRTLWHIYEIYLTRQYAKTIATWLLGPGLDVKKPGGIIGELGWPIVMVGDFGVRSGGSSLLAELHNVYFLNTIVAADKNPKVKDGTIENMNGEMIDGRIKILKGSKLAQEMTELEWRIDANGNRQERESMANHGCDSAAYLRHSLAPYLPLVMQLDEQRPEVPPPPPPVLRQSLYANENQRGEPRRLSRQSTYSIDGDPDGRDSAFGDW